MEGGEENEKTKGVKFIYRALEEGHMVVDRNLKVTEKQRKRTMMRIKKDGKTDKLGGNKEKRKIEEVKQRKSGK